MAELLLQVSDDRAGTLSRARSIYPADEAEEHSAAPEGRGTHYALGAGVLRLRLCGAGALARETFGMNSICIFIILIEVAIASAQVSPLKQLQKKISVQSVSDLTLDRLAGKYSNPPREMGAGLSGDDLYLFPDGTYIYDEWADIEPTTIRDKGKWTILQGFVQLTSDAEITWDAGAERKYLAVHRQTHADEILLVGTENALARFEQDAKDAPEIELLDICKERSKAISHSEFRKLKQRLMRFSWRPDHFKAEVH